jgi:hypothetical protein
MRLPLLLAAVSLLTSASDPPGKVTQAVHADKAIWLLRQYGELSRLDDDASAPVPVATPVSAIGLCRAVGGLTLVGSTRDGWQMLRREGESWRATQSTPMLPDEFALSVACGTDAVSLLTNRRIIDQKRGAIALRGYTPPGMSADMVAYRQRDVLIVGRDSGEWGGEVWRVPFATGRIEKIAGLRDPVHDIAASPGKPDCVVLAIGLEHMTGSRGKLVELCGTVARRVFAQPRDVMGVKSAPKGPDGDPSPSVAFYSLATASDGSLRAIGSDGVYRMAGAAVSGPEPLPQFVSQGDARVGRVAPDLDLVLNGGNGNEPVRGEMAIVVRR